MVSQESLISRAVSYGTCLNWEGSILCVEGFTTSCDRSGYAKENGDLTTSLTRSHSYRELRSFEFSVVG